VQHSYEGVSIGSQTSFAKLELSVVRKFIVCSAARARQCSTTATAAEHRCHCVDYLHLLTFVSDAITHCTALHCTALHCTALHCTAGSGTGFGQTFLTAPPGSTDYTAYSAEGTCVTRPQSLPGPADRPLAHLTQLHFCFVCALIVSCGVTHTELSAFCSH
jgi:hypothetical protein